MDAFQLSAVAIVAAAITSWIATYRSTENVVNPMGLVATLIAWVMAIVLTVALIW
jgi:hypothetical protein